MSVSRHERRFGDQRHSVNVLTFHTSTPVQQAPTRHSRRKLSVYKMRVKRECERKRLDTWMEGQTIYIYIHTRNYLETGNKANNMLMLAKGLLWRKHRTTSEGRADYFGGNSELLLGKTGQWEACDKQGESARPVWTMENAPMNRQPLEHAWELSLKWLCIWDFALSEFCGG